MNSAFFRLNQGKHFSATRLLPLLAIYLLLLLPAIAVAFFIDFYKSPHFLLLRLVAVCAVFTIPIVFFYRNLKVYLYLLTIWILLSPVFIYFVTLLDVRLNFSFIALILQTNWAEVREAMQGYELIFFATTLVYLLFYALAVHKTTITRLRFNQALAISGTALLLFTFCVLMKHYKYKYNAEDILEETYPLSLFSGMYQARQFMKKNNLDASKNFFFNAYKKDTIPGRKVSIFIIGESSRYDRWGVNGYSRPTSPRLSAQPNLFTFANVVAGCNLTWMSVPQMITRAHPDNIDAQFKEKSIMAAFNDAGYKTIWLSNQSDKELFWSGTITLHAKTANVSKFDFPSTSSYQGAFGYDEVMLPALDSLLSSDTASLFCVLHTYGSHWAYPDRYPPSFDVFKPSGQATELNPFGESGKEQISNTYDNSIRYTDYVIDSVIRMVAKHHIASTVTFLSDHGEDLFDAEPNKMNFHLKPSVSTIHVPLLMWLSDEYRKQYPKKAQILAAHRDKKIGPENTFYTLLDLANVSFPGFDSTKSIAGPFFQESMQKYYNNHLGRSFYYEKLLKWK